MPSLDVLSGWLYPADYRRNGVVMLQGIMESRVMPGLRVEVGNRCRVN